MEEYQEVSEIDLKDLMFYCLKRWRCIVICMVLFAVLAGVYKYQATVEENQMKREEQIRRASIEAVEEETQTESEPITFDDPVSSAVNQVKDELDNAKLLLIGDGVLFNDIKKLIEEKKLTNDVFMLGQREDVSDLLSAMDVFVLLSLYEGLPIVLVEAQVNGLPALVSNLVTDEVKYSDMIQYLPIDKGNEEWKYKLISGELHRYECPKELDEYDIQSSVLLLEEYYRKLLEEKQI